MYTHRTPQEMFNEELEHAIKVAERKYILLENEEGEETTFEESETYAEDHKAYAKYLQSLIHISEDATNGDVFQTVYNVKNLKRHQVFVDVFLPDCVLNFFKFWWDLPYKRGDGNA